MSLKPGTRIPQPGGVDGWAGSMAQAMEEAFLQEWPVVMNGAKTPDSNDQMKLMFIAIARGVVKHLVENHDSFKVTVTGGGGLESGEVSSIESSQSF